jgi:hypothetical protein
LDRRRESQKKPETLLTDESVETGQGYSIDHVVERLDERSRLSEQGWRRGVAIALAAISLQLLLNHNWVGGIGVGLAAFSILAKFQLRRFPGASKTSKVSLSWPLAIFLFVGIVGLLLYWIDCDAEILSSTSEQMGSLLMMIAFVSAVVVLMIWHEPKNNCPIDPSEQFEERGPERSIDDMAHPTCSCGNSRN